MIRFQVHPTKHVVCDLDELDLACLRHGHESGAAGGISLQLHEGSTLVLADDQMQSSRERIGVARGQGVSLVRVSAQELSLIHI